MSIQPKISQTATDTFRLDWTSENLRGYTIEGSPDLVAWADFQQLLGNGAVRSQMITMESPMPERFFWRIREGAMRPGFDQLAMARWNEHVYPETPSDLNVEGTLQQFGFTIKFYDETYNGCFVNDNGNITFDTGYSAYEPDYLIDRPREVIAPFYANTDTREPITPGQPTSNVIRISSLNSETINGRKAFGVSYRDVGYFTRRADKTNSFQMVIIDRNDTGVGNFDLEFNYDKIQWESADDSWGQYGGIGGQFFPLIGISKGDKTSAIAVDGWKQSRVYLDRKADNSRNTATGLIYQKFNSDFPGRFVFPFRDGRVMGDFTISAGSPISLPAAASNEVQLNSSITPLGTTGIDYKWLDYGWVNTGLPKATFTDDTAANPKITMQMPGVYVFQLDAKKNLGGSVNAYSRTFVSVYHAGELQVSTGADEFNSDWNPLSVGNTSPSYTLALNGSAIFNGGSVSLNWVAEEVPFDPNTWDFGEAIFSSSTVAQPTVTLTRFGKYRLRLTATTANGFSKYDVIHIDYRDTSSDP